MMARLIAATIRLRHPANAVAIGRDLPPRAEVLERLIHDGCSELGIVLSTVALDEIRAYLAQWPVIAPGGRSFPVEQPPADASVGAYPLEAVLRCPHLLSLANDPELMTIVGSYLGCQPTLSSIGLRWSYPSRSESHADTQLFHRDPDDWRFLKLLVYLTDVDAGAGPHSFIAGTHCECGRILARPYAHEDLARRYPHSAMRTFTGPAGSALLADTYGIHKGAAPQTRPRLAFLAQYSLLPIFALQYRPIRLVPRPPVDRYVNRLLLA
jgi:hypothetical protein